MASLHFSCLSKYGWWRFFQTIENAPVFSARCGWTTSTSCTTFRSHLGESLFFSSPGFFVGGRTLNLPLNIWPLTVGAWYKKVCLEAAERIFRVLLCMHTFVCTPVYALISVLLQYSVWPLVAAPKKSAETDILPSSLHVTNNIPFLLSFAVMQHGMLLRQYWFHSGCCQ